MEIDTDRLLRINNLLGMKVSKAEIARQLGISRKRLYDILARQDARTKPNKK